MAFLVPAESFYYPALDSSSPGFFYGDPHRRCRSVTSSPYRRVNPVANLLDDLLSLDHQTRTVSREGFAEDESKAVLTLDVAGCDPKDVRVRLDRETGLLVVSAVAREEKAGSVFTRSFERALALPEGVDREAIRSAVDKREGKLVITMPKKEALENKKEEEQKQVEHKEKQKQVEHNKENKERETSLKEMEVEVKNAEEEEEETCEPKAKAKKVEAVPEPEILTPFTARLRLNKYKPEEISVEVQGGCVKVSGLREEKVEGEEGADEGEGVTEVQNFARKIPVDGDAFDLAKVRCAFEDGVLTVTVPRRERREQEKGRAVEVPVKFA